MKNPIVQTVVLIAVAAVLALAANAMAPPQRKLILKGWYPNARTVPVRVEAPPEAAPVAETTTAMSPGPGAPRIEVPTTTIERPAGWKDPVTPATTAVATTTAAPAAAKPSVPAPAQGAAGGGGAPLDLAAKFPPHPEKPYVEIAGDDAALLHANGALFLDARRTSAFEQGHIAGARPFSVWEADIDEKVNALFEERSDPREQLQPIVIYCTGGACEDSHMLSQKLWGLQFNNVYVYKDGFPDWQKRNGAVKSGMTP